MEVKGIDRTANIAWSPEPQYPIFLAAGTAAQQLDSSFNTSASLEIFELNLSNPEIDLQLKYTIPTENRFHKISWGGYNFNSDNPAGAIVGGCDEGIIQIYNAEKVLSGEKILQHQVKNHSGPVRALEFNHFQKHLFASGGPESELFIWDLLQPGGPTHVRLGGDLPVPEDIVTLSWNNQVQHILATTFTSKCVIWDVRKKMYLMKINNSDGKHKWKSVTWNPDIATQLCLASEDDQNPAVEIWDLRFASSPIKALHGYTKGVMSVAWSTKDSELILGCGKDDHVICWNPSSANPTDEVVCRIPTASQWNFDVSWCPRCPNLFTVSSFDGNLGIYSITGGLFSGENSTKIADSFPGVESYPDTAQPIHQSTAELKKAPKWLKRSTGASFAFGGKLISFSSENKSVLVSRVITDPKLVDRSRALEQTLEAREFPAYCAHKIGTVSNVQEQNIWRFLSAHFDVEPRFQFQSLLGCSPEEVKNQLVQIQSALTNGNLETDFNNLALQNGQSPTETVKQDFNRVPPNASQFQFDTNSEINGLLQKALLLGNIPAAVDICLKENLLSEALIIASAGGSELLAKTQYKFFQLKKSPLSSLISAVVTRDWTSIVETCHLSSWAQVLVAVLTYAAESETGHLCETLGRRLEEAGGNAALNAELCYVASGNINKLVDLWTKVNGKASDKVQDLVEVVLILQKALQLRGKTVPTSGEFAELLSSYAEMLATQGDLETAVAYLGNSNDETIISLKNRCERALGRVSARQRSVSGNYYTQQKRPSLPANRPSVFQPAPAASQVVPPTLISQQPAQLPQPPTFVPTQPQPPTFMQTQNQPPVPSMPISSSQVHPANYNSTPAVPPPPSTPVPFQRSTNSPGPASARPKYVIDPSVNNTHYNSSYQPQPPMSRPQSSMGQPMGHPQFQSYNSVSQAPNTFQPIGNGAPPPPSAAVPAGPPLQSFNNPYSPGWNDPPVLSASKPPKRVEPVQAPPPITHPLFGAVPQNSTPQNFGNYQQPQQTTPQQFTPLQPNMYGGDVAHQPYYRNPQSDPVTQPNLPPIQQAKEVLAPPSRKPLPEEHVHLQTVFDELRSRCHSSAGTLLAKKKLEDIGKKLDLLYELLADSRLSAQTLQSLHQMVQLIQQGNYQGAIQVHMQLCSGPDFSNIASFMPSLKNLIQLAMQFGVYL